MRPQITLLAVGKLRETFWTDAAAEYQKRLSGYTSRFTVVEVADEKTPDNASPSEEDTIRQREADRLLARIGERDYVIALDGSRGRTFDSTRFTRHLERTVAEEGFSTWTFVLGGSLGLSETVLSRANLIWSFGELTLPHQLARIVLLEQLYRAFKINRGEAYHK